MATIVNGVFQKIYIEDVQTGASASEETMTKFAGSLNKLVDSIFLPVHFDIHGSYNIIGVPDNKVDKFYLVPFDCKIAIIHFYAGENVGSGFMEVDVVRKPLSGGESSIFSTRPKLSSSDGSQTDLIMDFIANTTPRKGAGATSPVLSIANLSKYDVLKFNIITKPTGFIDKLGLVIYLMPN